MVDYFIYSLIQFRFQRSHAWDFGNSLLVSVITLVEDNLIYLKTECYTNMHALVKISGRTLDA